MATSAISLEERATRRAPRFTIFTPTYNRAHTLHRVFDSLNKQTFRDFEWLVIDDGSTDDTSKLVAGWIKSADFSIRYVYQERSGKHFAHNRALAEARGYFFSCLDSDDALVPDALETAVRVWATVPECKRHEFYGVDGLCCDQFGDIVGDKYPFEPFDTDLREVKYIYRLRGEKWGVGLTEIVKRYPFPEIARGEFIPEGIVWLEIAKKYKTRAVNRVLRIYYIEDSQHGLTAMRRRRLGAHATGYRHYYVWLLNNDLEYLWRCPTPFLKAAAMLPVTGWLSGQKLASAMAALCSSRAKALVLALLPFSLLLYGLDNAMAIASGGNKASRDRALPSS